MANCKTCPAFYEATANNIKATAGGWVEKTIDGEKVFVCRPGIVLGEKKTMDRFCLYCLATPKGKKIANKASWTGTTPKWCPVGRDDNATKR